MPPPAPPIDVPGNVRCEFKNFDIIFI